MKQLIFFLLAFSFLVMTSCNNSSNVSENTDSQIDTLSASSKKVTNVNTWEGFWETIQAAAKQKDINAIKDLAIFGEGFSEEEFDEYVSQYFTEEMYQLIIDTSADNLRLSEGVVEAEEVRELSLDASGYDEEEDITYESALILYFGKIDEKYGLVMWMAAG